MTNLGTFWEGVILIVLAMTAAVVEPVVKVDWLMTAVAPGLLAIGVAYITGGSAGKAQMLGKLKRGGFINKTLTMRQIG